MNTISKLSKVTKRFQTQVPERIREDLDIHAGDFLIWTKIDDLTAQVTKQTGKETTKC